MRSATNGDLRDARGTDRPARLAGPQSSDRVTCRGAVPATSVFFLDALSLVGRECLSPLSAGGASRLDLVQEEALKFVAALTDRLKAEGIENVEVRML
jgi:hypothetical protein